ncbi:hypothetical protein psal_cds_1176 [Pandoravirus salinus]|uniref:Uncharacterized protein n=1 Tax=Pandoravirus salinus TaxID=1349410 RepID=S4VXR4_9VIRU|nr:hypothetical protein psal_cds_1176 [Pandoravirus salinus]AGO85454.1 hypothetical protein psal_cds_1176 [Pandoravirus salinus]
MFKRHLDECQRRRGADAETPAAKRVRYNGDVTDADLGDRSEYCIDPDTLVRLVATSAVAGFNGSLALAIAGASRRHIKRALYRVIDKPAAVARICDGAKGRIGRPDKVLQRAASQCAHKTVTVLVDHACSEFEITCVLARLIKQGDREGVLAIVGACESSPAISPVVRMRLVEAALGKATKRGALDTITDLAPACDSLLLRRVLIRCASRGYDIKVFEAVWEHADLCAHDLADDVEPGAARDFLHDIVHKGQGCIGACTPLQPQGDSSCATVATQWPAHADGAPLALSV